MRKRLAFRCGDEGFNLVELIVAMGLLAIFMGIVTTAIISMTQVMRKQQGQADAIDGNRVVAEKLGQSIRFANAITTPGAGTTAGSWYVEWRTGNITSATTPVYTCTQWRFVASTGLLQSRSWKDGDTTAAPAWSTENTGVSKTSGVNVFSLVPLLLPTNAPSASATAAAASPVKQQLWVQFTDTAGTQQTVARATQITLTAQNTASAAVQTNICPNPGSLPGGMRP